MVRIVLYDPPTQCNTNAPNCGLAYIGSSLKQLGYEVFIIDMSRAPNFRYKEADLIGISVKTHNYIEAQKVTNQLKKVCPNAKIVWGGAHITLMKEKLIDENPNVDHFIVGEGEFFTKNLNDKMCYMPYIEDLDSLPFPDYRLFDTYSQILELSYGLICSRGCPYSCTFCSVPLISGRKVRYRSVQNCIDEIKLAKNQGFRDIQILDDNFTFDLDFAKDFCREMKKVGIFWHMPNGIRADRFDEELAELMVSSGCYQVSFGVESAYSEVYKNIRKGEKLEDIERSVEVAKKYGLRVNCYFIIGLPNSTFERDLESLKWVLDHKVYANFGMLVPYPGTQVWDWVQDKLISSCGTHFGKFAYPMFETKEYPAEDMMDAFLIFNYVCKSGFTEEWYKTNNINMIQDLTKRVERHIEQLKKAGLLK
jgi:anaerobic magnesium-protoporphyrin IX monomethyl ester cyclase